MTARPTVTLHSDPASLFRSLEEYQQAFYNLLAPTTAIGYVPELHEISVRPVWVSAADDCYQLRLIRGAYRQVYVCGDD